MFEKMVAEQFPNVERRQVSKSRKKNILTQTFKKSVAQVSMQIITKLLKIKPQHTFKDINKLRKI